MEYGPPAKLLENSNGTFSSKPLSATSVTFHLGSTVSAQRLLLPSLAGLHPRTANQSHAACLIKPWNCRHGCQHLHHNWESAVGGSS